MDPVVGLNTTSSLGWLQHLLTVGGIVPAINKKYHFCICDNAAWNRAALLHSKGETFGVMLHHPNKELSSGRFPDLLPAVHPLHRTSLSEASALSQAPNARQLGLAVQDHGNRPNPCCTHIGSAGSPTSRAFQGGLVPCDLSWGDNLLIDVWDTKAAVEQRPSTPTDFSR
ncbi:hypothetical protein BO78DRAFT_123368 [Aspergillus sclerotiicarbonarius CBS 121057]|uniref:Uncharacterized protein n=1 Tax=Aspergillus sclerotiicarbonarius (strain CBS 121057 / IBT 28362) TaxID=1448318 RepID=A0A319EHP8_ASPSB|nr:hypothetical protein BO78DRAFT_123368 [Aspergillus sclerotiicarbonarius CBS 121057]